MDGTAIDTLDVVRGSGNVFRDLGHKNGDVLQFKAILAAEIIKALDRDGLSVPAAGVWRGSGCSTDVAATQTQGSAGVFGWSGIYGTTFWVDPKERLVAIMMVQRYPGSPVAQGFQPLVYQALTR